MYFAVNIIVSQTLISESPIRTKHKLANPGTYNVTVKVTNPVTEPIFKAKEIVVENPVQRKDFNIETEMIDHENGSTYHEVTERPIKFHNY